MAIERGLSLESAIAEQRRDPTDQTAQEEIAEDEADRAERHCDGVRPDW